MITTRDLMDRYNIKTRQGIIQFVKKHLDEINHDGEEHATMQKGEWAFDTEAVRILDQLRGLHDQATITELESEKYPMPSKNRTTCVFYCSKPSRTSTRPSSRSSRCSRTSLPNRTNCPKSKSKLWKPSRTKTRPTPCRAKSTA